MFLVIFLLALALKNNVLAGSPITNWLWGGSDTNFGWIQMDGHINGDAVNGASFGVRIDNNSANGYAWSENLGWIDFNPQDHCVPSPEIPGSGQYQAASCANPDVAPNGISVGNNILSGWARIVGIAQESVNGNSGGWEGWIKMSDTEKGYGVDITKMDGKVPPDPTDAGPTYAWSDELGWIDFGEASYVYLTASLTFEPSSPGGWDNKVYKGLDNNVDVILTASKTGGNASGELTYSFKCNDGNVATEYTAEYTHSCTYNSPIGDNQYTLSRIFNPSVTLKQGDIISDSASARVEWKICGNNQTDLSNGEACDAGTGFNGSCEENRTCSTTCQANICSTSNQWNDWKEVAP